MTTWVFLSSSAFLNGKLGMKRSLNTGLQGWGICVGGLLEPLVTVRHNVSLYTRYMVHWTCAIG